MRYLDYILITVVSALCTGYSILWLTESSSIEKITIPPLIFNVNQREILLWGGWKTVNGYQNPGINAVEIRCNREVNICTEAIATIARYPTGQDLEAQVFNYQITNWGDTTLVAISTQLADLCLERRLVIQLNNKTAALNWSPLAGCEADEGKAILIGDPL